MLMSFNLKVVRQSKNKNTPKNTSYAGKRQSLCAIINQVLNRQDDCRCDIILDLET